MKEGKDEISKSILKFIQASEEPLETREIEENFKKITRTILFYRLNNLRGDGLILGKQVGSGKGTWIWWKKGGRDE